ncbi:hypothetical protein IBTHAUMO2_350008 [Nitrosopumilaceae archaeon]|nr:hypothetical protein IBTHAUMO2_350008 [Nitrosopumilaceae archaeon]
MKILAPGCGFKPAPLPRIPPSDEYSQFLEGREVVLGEAGDAGAPLRPAGGILCKAITADERGAS